MPLPAGDAAQLWRQACAMRAAFAMNHLRLAALDLD
jgi:hypothetical protein